jgi:hypothetical protein
VRNALVSALIACSDSSLKTKARRFLQGLSSDELQFIAEYLGACILESRRPCLGYQGQLMTEFAYRPATPDQDHKMILLHEYLRYSGFPADARA